MGVQRFLVPRLQGDELPDGINRYLALVRKGVAGFILFGGRLEEVRDGIRRLQEEAPDGKPLIICADLEQGLGQQVRGGTLFPPALALAESPGELLGAAFRQMAAEAAYSGINTILAPVLDLNTNPENPIISTRSFGADPARVASMGAEMIRALNTQGIKSCGKHFPGHGDTAVDSHLGLPTVRKSLSGLQACELIPFEGAIEAGVDMMMMGHLGVPALDPTGRPASLSTAAVKYLREKMGFYEGVITTDAMDMGGLDEYAPEEAALMALRAGVDMLLHPEDPERLAHDLRGHSGSLGRAHRLEGFRESLPPGHGPEREAARAKSLTPPFDESIARELTRRAIRITGPGPLRPLKDPFVLILSDEEEERGEAFLAGLRKRYPSLRHRRASAGRDLGPMPVEGDIIVAVFSSVRAYKGGPAPWIGKALLGLKGKVHTLASFGSPHLIDAFGADRLYAYWNSQWAEEDAARVFTDAPKGGS
jgi:beta-glucosidase-like glycosyl hydrolase